MLADLERLHAVRVDLDGEAYLTRTELAGKAYLAFQAVGLRPPLRARPLPCDGTTPTE